MSPPFACYFISMQAPLTFTFSVKMQSPGSKESFPKGKAIDEDDAGRSPLK